MAQPGDQEFCARYQLPESRIVQQACKTMSGWESMGIELLLRK